MAKKQSKGLGIGKIITLTILLIVAGAVIYGLIFFTNGGTDSFKSFFIEIDGKIVVMDTPITLAEYTERTIKAKYLLPTNEDMTFKAKIVATDERVYSAKLSNAGTTEKINSTVDVSKQFNLKIDGENITFSIAKWNVQEIISAKCGEPVTLEDFTEDYTKPYFILVISSFNDKIVYKLPIMAEIPISEITIDKDNVLFK